MQTQAAPTPAAPHDHHDCIDKAIHTAEQLCMHRGARFTPIRRKVLELIWESHRAVKAYDLLDRIKPYEQAAKPVTIYRALEFLVEQGLIHRVESLNAFIGCVCSDRRHELLLLICRHCHEVEERPAVAVMAALAEEMQQAGFSVHRKAIEIHGLCAHCVAGAAPGSAGVPPAQPA
ncbi:MAG: transcriptional repressor [Methylococcaceae bacterium]|nr:MAG: transcriptional repressor [Methylococcaceae bacterium]